MARRSSSSKGFLGKTKPQPVSAWSFSRWRDYMRCPRFFKHKHIDKITEPENEAMRNGTRIHKLAEDYITGKLKRLPLELGKFKEEFAGLKKRKAKAEVQAVFTKGWERETVPTDWNGAWVRVKIDAIDDHHSVKLNIIDHKTGRIKDEDREQMPIYAIAGFLKYPHAQELDTSLFYLDHGEIIDEPYSRDQLPQLIKDWDKKTSKLLTDTEFKEKPGNACAWCPYSKGKGGPCRF